MRGFLRVKSGIPLAAICTCLLILMWASPLTAEKTSAKEALKIALLPILDSFPFYVAEGKGYFNKYGVNVKVIPVASGLERDQLMQSGEIDGMLNEMMTTANFNRAKVQLKIVISARTAYPDYPLFRVLSAPGSGLKSVADLAGNAIGISKNTIIEYVTDRILSAKGLRPDSIVKKSVPVIPERFQLLMQGRLKAATLPDPLAQSALEAGAGLIVDDSAYPQYSVSVLSFSVDSLQTKQEAVRHFLKAWNQAAADINADPEAYRGLLLKKIRVPKNVRGTYKIPPFPLSQIPDSVQWADVMGWMVEKGLLKAPLPYRDSVTTEYLP
jgi:NitT/TauT family transport system substrate-binding protein